MAEQGERLVLYDKFEHGTTRTKKRVRAGDPVAIRRHGHWRRGFVHEATPTGVWVVECGDMAPGRHRWRSRGQNTSGIAHWFAEDSPLWCRDKTFWDRMREQKKERRIGAEQAFQTGRRWSFLTEYGHRKPAKRGGTSGRKGVPKYLTPFVANTVRYIPPPVVNYAAPKSTGSTISSQGLAALSGQAKRTTIRAEPKKKKEEEEAGAAKLETPEEQRKKSEELDRLFREKMAAKLERKLAQGQKAAAELETALDMIRKKKQAQDRANAIAGIRKARARRERLLRELGILSKAPKKPMKALLHVKKDGYKNSSMVVHAGERVVVLDTVSGTATIITGPATVQLLLSEVVLPEDQARLVLEAAVSPSIDLADLALPTSCWVDSVPVRPLPEWAEKLEPLHEPDSDISDLMRHERAQQPDSRLVGLTRAEVAAQLRQLAHAHDSGFIVDEDYRRRKRELENLHGSDWVLPDASVSRVAPKQKPIVAERITDEMPRCTPPPEPSSLPARPRVEEVCAKADWFECPVPDVSIAPDFRRIGASMDDLRRELADLESLHESGWIQETEYEQRKQGLATAIKERGDEMKREEAAKKKRREEEEQSAAEEERRQALLFSVPLPTRAEPTPEPEPQPEPKQEQEPEAKPEPPKKGKQARGDKPKKPSTSRKQVKWSGMRDDEEEKVAQSTSGGRGDHSATAMADASLDDPSFSLFD